MRDGFILHEENMDDLLELSDQECAAVVRELIRHYRGEDPVESEDKVVRIVSRSICGRMDRDKGTYQKKAEIGAKGGRQKAENIANSTKVVAKRSKGVAKSTKAVAKSTKAVAKSTKAVAKSTPVPVPVTCIPVPEINNNPPLPPLGGKYSADPGLDDAVTRYIAHRKKIRKPITDEGSIQRLLKKLDSLADTTEDKIAIINQSIDNCWQGLFPLKEPRARPPEKKDSKDVLLRIMRGEE